MTSPADWAPQSKLTYERPDLWARALLLATDLTGYEYAPKLPLEDGTIYACGGGGNYVPVPPDPPAKRIKELEGTITRYEDWLKRGGRSIGGWDRSDELRDDIAKMKKKIEEIKKENPIGFDCRVYVPEGAMEWLLHEVGHWVVATPEERLLPNYGYGTIKQKGWGAAREWQAWGFEEIILSPFGSARLLAAPEHRGGTVYSKSGPMPDFATAHAERQMQSLGVDRERWRQIYGEWMRWKQ